MKINFDILSCIVLPVIGYYTMATMRKRAKVAIANKMFAFGMHRFKPVYGDKVITIASGYERSGVIIFVFTIFFPALMLLIKYLK